MKNLKLLLLIMFLIRPACAEILASGDNCEYGTTNCKWKVEIIDDKRVVTFYTEEGVTAQANSTDWMWSYGQQAVEKGYYGGTNSITDLVVEGTAVKNENGTYTATSGIVGNFSMTSDNGLRSLSSVTLPNSITGITSLRDTPNLKTLEIPESVTMIGSSAFKNSGIETIVINSREVGQWAFENTTNLKTIVLGDNVNFMQVDSLKNTPSDSVIYCQEGEGHNRQIGRKLIRNTCESLIQVSNFGGTLISYTVDPDTGKILANGKMYASLNDLAFGTQVAKPKKLIYTVEEAEKVSKTTGNKFMIRYK